MYVRKCVRAFGECAPCVRACMCVRVRVYECDTTCSALSPITFYGPQREHCLSNSELFISLLPH